VKRDNINSKSGSLSGLEMNSGECSLNVAPGVAGYSPDSRWFIIGF
jgi:hypothetical protein